MVESLKVITREASLRIARYAFRYARNRGYQRVTAVPTEGRRLTPDLGGAATTDEFAQAVIGHLS